MASAFKGLVSLACRLLNSGGPNATTAAATIVPVVNPLVAAATASSASSGSAETPGSFGENPEGGFESDDGGHQSAAAPWEESVEIHSEWDTQQRMEKAILEYKVRKAAPAWLPFVPGSCYWVPPGDLSVLKTNELSSFLSELSQEDVAAIVKPVDVTVISEPDDDSDSCDDKDDEDSDDDSMKNVSIILTAKDHTRLQRAGCCRGLDELILKGTNEAPISSGHVSGMNTLTRMFLS